MKIKDVIGSEQVEVGLRVSDKSQLLRELSRRAAAAASIDQNVVHDALMAREKLGSTGLGKGFALPHARPLLLTARLIQQALHLIMEPSLPFWRSDAPAVTGTDELIDVDQCGEKPDIH